MTGKRHVTLSYEVTEATSQAPRASDSSSPAEPPPAAERFPPGAVGGDWPPPGLTKVLLHSCCAPCSGAMIEEMRDKGLDVTVFFYNPNIHLRKEYEIRKEENKRYAAKLGIGFVDADYDTDEWFRRAKGMEYDPERGARCTMCFDMRMERTAQYALENGYRAFTTTNATSRWKDIDQVNSSGIRVARRLLEAGIEGAPLYWVYNWQTDGMTQRKYEISARERFYKQEYCGCAYSLRDSNAWRKKEGIPKVRIGGEEAGLGSRWFEDPVADAQEESQDVVDSFFRQAEGGGLLSEAVREQYHTNLSARDATW